MKTLSEAINEFEAKRKMSESSLSRVYRQTKEHDAGTISAFRSNKDCNTGDVISKSENLKRSKQLKAKLLQLGYGVTRIDGVYIEDYKSNNPKHVKEESYLVVDLKDSGNLKKDLIKLGQLFEQDSITFQDHKTGTYYLISANNCPEGYPGQGKVGKEVKLGKPLFGRDGEFHSKVNGRPFVFEKLDKSEKLSDYYPTEIRSIVAMAKELDEKLNQLEE